MKRKVPRKYRYLKTEKIKKTIIGLWKYTITGRLYMEGKV